MNPDAAVNSLAGLRVAFGTGAWATPNLAGMLFGLDVAGNPQGPYLGRLFGIREIALAAGTLASKGEARRTWLLTGLLCDAADAGAAMLGRRDGYFSMPVTARLAVPAIAAVALGVIALQGSGD